MKVRKYHPNDVIDLMDYYMQKEKLTHEESKELITNVIIANELVRKHRQMRRKRRQVVSNYVLGIVMGLSFLCMVLSVGAADNNLKLGLISAGASLVPFLGSFAVLKMRGVC